MDDDHGSARYRSRALRDVVVVVAGAVLVFASLSISNVGDAVDRWLGRIAQGQQDEVLIALWLAAVGFAALAARRWRDAARHALAERAAEDRFRAVVEKIPAVTYTWDPTKPPGATRVLYVSPQVEPILGFSVAEWVSDPDLWVRQIHDDDREAVLAASEGSDRTGEPFVAEYRHRRPDGGVVWIHEEAVAVARDDAGVPSLVQGVMYDITPRKRAEAALRQAEERYRTLVERVPAVAYIWDSGHPDGRPMRYVSPQLEPLLGLSVEEWTTDATAWARHVHPDDHERVVREWREASASGVPFHSEYRIVRGDGVSSWVRDEAVPVGADDQGRSTYQGILIDITERRVAEERLREAEERYRRLVEQLPAITYAESADGRLEYVSPQIESILGFTQEEWMASPDIWERQLHDDDRERVLAANAAPYEPGVTFRVDYRIHAKDGHVVWLHNEAVPVLGDDGRPVSWQGVVMDVTERKLADEALAAAEARFRTLVEQIPAVTYIHGPRSGQGLVYVSPQLETMLGYTPEEWGDDLSMFWRRMHPDDVERVRAEDERTDDTGEPFGLEYRMYTKDDRLLWIRDEAVLVRDPDGVPLFWQGVRFDVTAQKEAEAHLREAEERYRAIVEHIPGAIYIDVPDGSMRTIYASPQIRDILGVTPEAWMASPDAWLELIHPDDREEMERSYVDAARAGEAWKAEYRVMRPEGRWVWVHDETTFVRDDAGRPLFLQGVLFDITERKHAEEALHSSERRERQAAERLRALDEMKNTFLAAVSHELRSPLTSILGLALTLQQQEVGFDERRDLLERLATNARKLDRLLGDLLDIDRLNRGIVHPQTRPVELGGLVRRTIENLDLIGSRTVLVDAEDVTVLADPPKVERIVENLVVNALRHSGDDATVWVRVERDPDGAVIAVEDDGPGVPPELRREIFAPFRQGPSASPHSPGTGIGLSLVSMFAELHGGRAWVDERVGGGASFRVFLPFTHAPDEPGPPEAGVATVGSSEAG
jgi:PAS domain S-box-containing protein